MKISLPTLEQVKAFARPFTTYAGTIYVGIGIIMPSVTADKMWVAAALAGTMGVARSFDKRVTISKD